MKKSKAKIVLIAAGILCVVFLLEFLFFVYNR